MSSLKRSNNSNAHINSSNDIKDTNHNNETRMRSSTKRPRAPIACFRCHHKKVRCDGAHPNCTRCLSTGVLCAYPSSRRSRTTQPTNVDPFIDNLSHLEARIRRIESDLENQRNMVQSITTIESNVNEQRTTVAKDLNSKMIKTEMEVQDSRSILAQLRLRGEQRISRNKRAAASSTSQPSDLVPPTSITKTLSSSILAKHAKLKVNSINGSSNTKQPDLKSTSNRTNGHAKVNNLQSHQSTASVSSTTTATSSSTLYANSNQTKGGQQPSSLSPSFYFPDMMQDNDNSLPTAPCDHPPPGHGMDWTLFDQDAQSNYQKYQTEITYHPHHPSEATQQQAINDLFMTDYSMFQDMSMSPTSTRSSSLVSQLGGYPVTLYPSNSTGSTASNMTGLSSTTSCSSINTSYDSNIFNFSMDNVVLQSSNSHMESGEQDVHMISANPALWYCS